jgi:copper homeostasis protein (lipoprotein)
VKTAILSVMAASTLFVLLGCNNRSETQTLQPTQSEALAPMQQSWRGVLPCADCEGIETSLFLEKDGTWVMNQRYQAFAGCYAQSDTRRESGSHRGAECESLHIG